jgi:hypothetical protein
MKIHRPKTIDEAINDLHAFLDSDMWYAFNKEMKSEKDLCKYLNIHFKILRQQIKYIRKKRNGKRKSK